MSKKNNISYFKKKKIIVIIAIIILTGLFAGLTKAGVISNYLDLEILCSLEDIDTENKLINTGGEGIDVKPLIYLYPEERQDLKVELDYNGEIFADYPEYNYDIKGWSVNAYPDGKIINKNDNKEYSYLFWEGIPKEKINWDLSKGFIVEGINSREFLQNILPKIGLTPKEYNEFIVYWYPIMQKNKYNLVHFAKEQYTNYAKLETIPKYDSMLRVFMVLKPLKQKVEIKEQKFEKFERKGLTVVEWGGTILK